MIRVYAYQCEFCKSLFADENKTIKCTKACRKKDQRKKKSKAYQAKLRKQADWFRLNLSSIEDIPVMIEKFYSKFHKRKVAISSDRGIRIEKNMIILSLKGKSLDGKDVSYDPMTSSNRFGFEARDGGPVISGMDLHGGASGYGNGFSAGVKLDINECPKLLALYEEKNNLKEKFEEYTKTKSKIQSKVNSIINSDELYVSHCDRQKIFGSYSNLANKLANERKAELHNQKYPEIEKELMTEELKSAYIRYSELCSALCMDVQ